VSTVDRDVRVGTMKGRASSASFDIGVCPLDPRCARRGLLKLHHPVVATLCLRIYENETKQRSTPNNSFHALLEHCRSRTHWMNSARGKRDSRGKVLTSSRRAVSTKDRPDTRIRDVRHGSIQYYCLQFDRTVLGGHIEKIPHKSN
jgi:hypothetical protein